MNIKLLNRSRLFISFTMMLFFCSPVAQAIDCDGKKLLSEENAAGAIKIVALEYPVGTSFEEWRKRVDTQLVCELFKRLNLRPDFTLMPYRRGFAEMGAGNTDIMVGSEFILKPEARCHMKMIPFRHYNLLAYYYAQERVSPEPTTLQDFAGKRIVGIQPEIFQLLTGWENAKISAGQAVSHQFAILRLGRADYIFAMAGATNQFASSKTGPEEAGRHFKLPELLSDHSALPETENTGQFFGTTKPFLVAESGLVVNMKRPGMGELFDQLAAELDRFRQEDRFKEMVEHKPEYLNTKKPEAIVTFEHMEENIARICAQSANSQ